MLAVRRLRRTPRCASSLDALATPGGKQNATPAHAAAAWMQILEEAATLAPPPRPDDWPTEFGADGTELARIPRIRSGEFGLDGRF